MSLLTMRKIFDKKNEQEPILEAKYDLEPDESDDGGMDDSDEFGNENSEQDYNDTDEGEDSPDFDEFGNQEEGEDSDGFGSGDDEGEFGDAGDSYEDDPYGDNPYGDDGEEAEPTRSQPEIKVLDLTKEEQLLANSRLLDQVVNLKQNIVNSLNTIRDIHTSSTEHQIISKEVDKSLSDTLKDIEIFVSNRMSDIYETNVKTFIGLLERYSLTMKLYYTSYDSHVREDK